MATYLEVRTRREILSCLESKGIDYCVNRLFEMARREEELKNELRRLKDGTDIRPGGEAD